MNVSILCSFIIEKAKNQPGFQIGFRAVLIDELLEVDITWGRGFEKNIKQPGFNFGLAFTPSEIW